MKILCAINQAECFRRGIDAPASTIKIEVNPAKLPEELRAFVADNIADGHRLSLRDEFYLRRPDLIGFMEAILIAKAFSQSEEYKDSFYVRSIHEWMKEVDKATKDEWEKRAKELAEAQSDDVLLGDVRKQKIAQAALSKSDNETREEQHEKRMNEQYEKRMNEQEKLGPEKPFGSKK
jgi:hypothetical protein